MVAQLPVFISLFYMLRKNLRTDICPTVQTSVPGSYATPSAHHHRHVPLRARPLSQTTRCTYCHAHYPGAGFLFIHDITNTATGCTLVVLLVLYVGTQVLRRC